MLYYYKNNFLCLEFNLYGTFRSMNISVYMNTASTDAITGILQVYINETIIFDSKVIIKSDGQLNAVKTLNLNFPKVFFNF